jgi:hypothetical protein
MIYRGGGELRVDFTVVVQVWVVVTGVQVCVYRGRAERVVEVKSEQLGPSGGMSRK